jgi:hypothetical protein
MSEYESEYEKQLRAEKKELETKIDRLDAMDGTVEWEAISKTDRALVLCQRSAMGVYSICLESRIALLSGEPIPWIPPIA